MESTTENIVETVSARFYAEKQEALQAAVSALNTSRSLPAKLATRPLNDAEATEQYESGWKFLEQKRAEVEALDIALQVIYRSVSDGQFEDWRKLNGIK